MSCRLVNFSPMTTQTKVTAGQIRAIVESHIEPAEPQTAILTYLKAHDGKALTERDATNIRINKLNAQYQIVDGASEALLALLATVRIRKVAGMTSLEWGGYSASGGNKGGSLLCSYDGKPVINAEKIEKDFGACWFRAREERNAERAKVLNAPVTTNPAQGVGVVASVFQQAADAINAINEAQAKLALLLEHDALLYTERYEIKALVEKP